MLSEKSLPKYSAARDGPPSGPGAVRRPPAVERALARAWTEPEAFAYCSNLTRSHYENFPVGSFLIPARLRPAVQSLYAFMRTADDFADEGRQAGDEAERLAWLASWQEMLADCEQGKARHPIFIALRRTLEEHRLPVEWLRDLLHAFTLDVTVRRYPDYADLEAYCRYSANPVGRLILTLFGYRDEELYLLSDAVCTGLQLANHWQDVAIDLKKNRIYLPQEDLRRFGVTEGQLFERAAGAGGADDSRFRELMAFEVARARGLFERGASLPERVRGRLRWELRLTRRGGIRVLEKIAAARYDVFRRRPAVTKKDWLALCVLSFLGPGASS